MEKTQEILDKAKERGFEVVMTSGDHKWYSLYNERTRTNLQIWIDKEEFEISHMIGAIRITTDKCGSFMNDEHFNRIHKSIRKIIFDLL